jgi:hypothetical protein
MRVRFAAKRLQILAQGFSPGNGFAKVNALKGRPTRGRLRHIEPAFSGGNSCGLVDGFLATPSVGLHFRSPFQVDSGADVFPGLKPWAVLLDHFMVKAGCVATINHQSPITNHQSPPSNALCCFKL